MQGKDKVAQLMAAATKYIQSRAGPAESLSFHADQVLWTSQDTKWIPALRIADAEDVVDRLQVRIASHVA